MDEDTFYKKIFSMDRLTVEEKITLLCEHLESLMAFIQLKNKIGFMPLDTTREYLENMERDIEPIYEVISKAKDIEKAEKIELRDKLKKKMKDALRLVYGIYII